MATRTNELFIGTEYLNIQGRSVKHPALIKYYAPVNPNKMSKFPVEVAGLDIETNHKTGELMLLGIDNKDGYRYYTTNFVEQLFKWVKMSIKNKTSLAYWNKLDPFVLLRTMLKEDSVTYNQCYRALSRFGKESGEWNRKQKKWDVPPVVSINVSGFEFGIKNAIRSSIQFYIISPTNQKMKTVWAYDIAALYNSGLEKEATARFSWYSKVDKSAHLVDWKKFETDKNYRENIVLKSNELDARACRYLADRLQEDFFKAFATYPKTLVSQGSLARTAIVADITNINKPLFSKNDELEDHVAQEVKSIGIMNYYDRWADQYGKEFMKDLYCLLTEAYSGGYIDAISYGYTKSGWYADIASAYPGVIQHLYDLRGAKWEYGTGEPKRAKKGYTFIRGTVKIPSTVNYHPLTVKHPFHKDTNVRPTGEFKGSYIIEERDYLLKHGAEFKDEQWYMVETDGKRSALANVCLNFIQLRKKLKKEGNSAEYMAKIAANSLYGILFEAVDTHEEFEVEKNIKLNKSRFEDYKLILQPYKQQINLTNIKEELRETVGGEYHNILAMWHNEDSLLTPEIVAEQLKESGIDISADHPTEIMTELNDLFKLQIKTIKNKTIIMKEIRRVGYRAGEFWNPLYASVITGKTRVLMSKAATSIEENGGTPIVLMTDSITWKGTKDMLSPEYIRTEKTLGYYEQPEQVKDIICLGSGRYGFKRWDKRSNSFTFYEAKRRGLNAVDIHDANGDVLGGFNWEKVLREMDKQNKTTIDVTVKTLISPGVVYLSNKYTINDLGRIIEQKREIQSIVGTTKRHIDPRIKDPKQLVHKLIKTRSLHLDPYMYGKYHLSDQTLPQLREMLMKLELKTKKQSRKTVANKAGKKYYQKNQQQIRQLTKLKYSLLRQHGYTVQQSKKMASWSKKQLCDEGVKL